MTALYKESHSLSFTKIRIVIVFVQISSVFIQKSIHKSRLLEMFKYKMSMYETVKSLFYRHDSFEHIECMPYVSRPHSLVFACLTCFL